MKFEYDDKSKYHDMVGFIDDSGDLCFEIGGIVIYITEDSAFESEGESLNYYAESNGVKKAIYPGDKITITF